MRASECEDSHLARKDFLALLHLKHLHFTESPRHVRCERELSAVVLPRPQACRCKKRSLPPTLRCARPEVKDNATSKQPFPLERCECLAKVQIHRHMAANQSYRTNTQSLTRAQDKYQPNLVETRKCMPRPLEWCHLFPNKNRTLPP